MDILFLIAGGVGVAGVISIVAVLALSRRGGGGRSLEGYSSFEAARKVRADAYLLAIDIDANTIRWIPLQDMGNYYLFLTEKTGRFLPIERRPLNLNGYPVFVGLKTGSSAIELTPELSLRTSIMKLVDKGEISQAKSFLGAMRKLYELVAREPVPQETSQSDFSIEADYTGLFTEYAVTVARAFERIMDASKSYLIASFERGEAVEKKPSQLESWGRFLIYLVFALLIGAIAFIVLNYIR